MYAKHAYEVEYRERCQLCNKRIDEYGFCDRRCTNVIPFHFGGNSEVISASGRWCDYNLTRTLPIITYL